jgi:hypothetical protein
MKLVGHVGHAQRIARDAPIVVADPGGAERHDDREGKEDVAREKFSPQREDDEDGQGEHESFKGAGEGEEG